MSNFSRKRLFPWVLVSTLFLFPLVATAQWPADPSLNLPLADGLSWQVDPHFATTSDGGCYLGWRASLDNGYFNFLLQRLTPSGVEQFPHNGLIVSEHPTETFNYDWALIVDRDDNAVLVFSDIREGGLNLYIYKIDPAGNFLWGADGIALSDNGQFWGFPSLTETADGDIVVIWPEEDFNTAIMMQRLSPTGDLLLGDGGIQIAGRSGKKAYAALVIPSDENNVIVAWSPDYDMESERQITAQKFDPNGAPLWPDQVAVFDTGTIPMGLYFSLQSDSSGGALLAWTSAVGFELSCQIQHLSPGGIELFPHNGLNAFPVSENWHVFPALNHDPATGETWLIARSQNIGQSNWGLSGQKLGLDGSYLWGVSGKELLPVDGTWKSRPRSVLVPDLGAMVFQLTGSDFSPDEDILIGALVNADGDFVWPQETVIMSSTLSDKRKLWAIASNDGVAKAIWEDGRNDMGDIFGQNLNPDGTLGQLSSPVVDLPAPSVTTMSIFPNPFNPGTTIQFETETPQAVSLSIFSVDGRRVLTLIDEVRGAGKHEEYWDGRDKEGLAVSAGTYFARLEFGNTVETKRMALIK